MSERLVHQRTKGPASTPAQRMIELTNELGHTQRLLAEADAKVERLQADYDIYHRVGDVSFGGIEVAQYRCEFQLWEWLLNENPQVRAVFELGTWNGGFAWWLWAQTRARRMTFVTYDSIVPNMHIPPGMAFQKTDLFANSVMHGEFFREWEPCVVFCDNGNKPRELQTYSQELRSPESLLVVHDWETEIMPEDVPGNVVMVYEEFCVMLGSMSRAFRLKGDTDD